jgi:putative solute:sodium symporter small subunit
LSALASIQSSCYINNNEHKNIDKYVVLMHFFTILIAQILFILRPKTMENKTNDYHISFFKPTTPQALYNRNMVAWLVLIWVIAIFGFHILLRVIEKPTPEADYITFQKVWPQVEQGEANEEEMEQFGKATLSVLGKIMLTDADRQVLKDGLSYSVYQLTPNARKEEVTAMIRSFEEKRASIENISNPDYIIAKKQLSSELSPVLNLSATDIRTKILPLELTSKGISDLAIESKTKLPAVMKKYMVHNQSVLTDFKFLGFPFHYFYTAVFLLILFVGLCWLYCVLTDRVNAKLDIAD